MPKPPPWFQLENRARVCEQAPNSRSGLLSNTAGGSPATISHTHYAIEMSRRERRQQATAAARRRRGAGGHSIDQQAATGKPAGGRTAAAPADQGHICRTRRDESRRRRLIIILSPARSPVTMLQYCNFTRPLAMCDEAKPHARTLSAYCVLSRPPSVVLLVPIVRSTARRLSCFSCLSCDLPPALVCGEYCFLVYSVRIRF